MRKGDIEKFYKDHVANKPYIITVYGDKNRIKLEALQKLGKIEVLELRDVMVF